MNAGPGQRQLISRCRGKLFTSSFGTFGGSAGESYERPYVSRGSLSGDGGWEVRT